MWRAYGSGVPPRRSNARLVEVVRDEPSLAMQVRVSALLGVRRGRGESRRIDERGVERARVPRDHPEVLPDGADRARVRVCELGTERVDPSRRVGVPEHALVGCRHDERRGVAGEPVDERVDRRRVRPTPRRAICLDRRARDDRPARRERRRLGLVRGRDEEAAAGDRAVRLARGWRAKRLVSERAKPRERVGEGLERDGVRTCGAPRGRGEGVALVIGPLEPPRRRVQRGERHLAARRHAIAVREEIREELRVRALGVDVGVVQEPGARVQQLDVRADGVRLRCEGDVPLSRA
jgi:hypothetical protein